MISIHSRPQAHPSAGCDSPFLPAAASAILPALQAHPALRGPSSARACASSFAHFPEQSPAFRAVERHELNRQFLAVNLAEFPQPLVNRVTLKFRQRIRHAIHLRSADGLRHRLLLLFGVRGLLPPLIRSACCQYETAARQNTCGWRSQSRRIWIVGLVILCSLADFLFLFASRIRASFL